MKRSIRVSFCVYFSTIKLIVPYLAMFAASFFTLFSLYGSQSSPISFLLGSLKLGILGIVYFAFSSYEFTSQIRRIGGRECIAVVKGAERNLIFSEILILAIPLICWAMLIWGWQIASCVGSCGDYPRYAVHSLLSVLLYCIMPSVISILLGACLASRGRPTAYGCIALASILFSSVFLQILSGGGIGTFRFVSVLDWFSISVPNSNWVADGVYGISMEFCRWVLVAFWSLLLFAALLWKYSAAKEHRLRFIAGLAGLLAIACGVRFAFRSNDYVLYKDNRSSSIVNSEYQYRRDREVPPAVPANFTVEQYELDLSIRHNLKAEATLYLSQSDLSLYQFTLYHGLNVHSVVDEMGEPLDFQRNGDFLDVSSAKPIKAMTISYSGQTWKYFSNEQGIALPGYFPYYPMAGHLCIWDSNNNSVKVNTKFNEASFSVHVNTALKVFSNLPEQAGRNTFSGTASTVSLYAGLLSEENHNGVVCLSSPVDGRTLSFTPEKLEEAWEKLARDIGCNETMSASGKTIILQPYTIGAAGASKETFVLLDDHILIADLMPSIKGACIAYLEGIVPEDPYKSILREKFLQYLYSQDAPSSPGCEKPSYSSMAILKKYSSAGEIADIDEWNEYLLAQEGAYGDLFTYQMSVLGEETVLKAIYQYLTSPDQVTHPVDFLYNLGGDSDA